MENGVAIELNGLPIMKKEIITAVKPSKDRKAISPDQIPVDVLKLLEDSSISVLQRILNQIYNTG